jgi:flagella basal body P-ring formation protein FlgA
MRASRAKALCFLLAVPGYAAGGAPAPVVEALERAVHLPGARVEASDFRPELARGCTVIAAELSGPLTTSGRIPVRLSGSLPGGERCSGWGWVMARLLAPALVASRALPAGTPLEGAVTPQEREVRTGQLPVLQLPAGAVAGRAIAAGQVLEERDLRVGPVLGQDVTVLLRLGAIRVEQIGRAVPCARGRACAQMPSGKRVEGTWQGGRIHVEST